MKIAFIVQRYGLEVNGGAELLCRKIAEHLSKYHTIEIITTCAIDYVTWKDEYPEGVSSVNGIIVHRFLVDYPRDSLKFNHYSEKILRQVHSTDDEIEWMRLQGPYSSNLFRYIEETRDIYDLFVFFTYLYCTTFFGLPIVSDKALLVPTAHDEPPVYLSIFNELFHLPQALLFNTEEERNFVHLRFQNDDIPYDVIGTGIDVPCAVDAGAFEQEYGISNFIVYVGRIDISKGCSELFDFFIRFKTDNPGPLKLVLLGKAVMEVPHHPDILSLGFVSEQDKFNCISASDLLVMPSAFESLSIVLFEAWYCNRPVLVNGKSEVLKGQCTRSNGGLWYTDYHEFQKYLQVLNSQPETRKTLGENGKRYVVSNYSWEIIEQKYLQWMKKIKTRG